VPLAPANRGQLRSLTGSPMAKVGADNLGVPADSEADSAGSIPVTRSTLNAQATIVDRP